MSTLARFIENASRVAAQEIIVQVEIVERELAETREHHHSLRRENAALKDEIADARNSSTGTIEVLRRSLADQLLEIRTLKDNLKKAMEGQESLRREKVLLEERVARSLSTGVDEMPDLSAISKTQAAEACDQAITIDATRPGVNDQQEAGIQRDEGKSNDTSDRLTRKYKKLKECYETMQARYRRERNVWKQWIEVFEGLDANLLKTKSVKTLPATPLVELSPNITPVRELAVTEAASAISTEGTKPRLQLTKQAASGTANGSGRIQDVSAGGGLETQSIDLDQVTRRRDPFSVSKTSKNFSSDLAQERPWTAAGMFEPAHGASGSSQVSSSPSQVRFKVESPNSQRVVTPRSLKRSRSEAELTTPSRTTDAKLGRFKTGLPSISSRTPGTDLSIDAPSDRILEKYGANEVVRGSARQALHASDCACCSTFYRLAGPGPASRAPLWDSPKASRTMPSESVTSRQQVGRHRSVWRRSPTPPEFWNCDFPTTQELREERLANERRKSRLLGQKTGIEVDIKQE